MKGGSSITLGMTIKGFLSDYMPKIRGTSPNTILSYRDSLKLFLLFLAQHKRVSVSDLRIEDMGVAEIISFLEYLEQRRHNQIATRNSRLAALHCFFRYAAARNPEYLLQCQRILNIPFKRMATRTIEYLEFVEINALLETLDRSRPDGRRDYVLLALMFNTGARVQEVLDLKANDLQLSKPFSVRINGKGRKERICPIWPETAQLLREYLEERGIDQRQPTTVFTNHVGKPLTRFGVRYILARSLSKAAAVQPTIEKKRLHPHSVRHSTAVHLLKSGVDLSTIAHWLGHANINTTNRYATIDLEMKCQALQKAESLTDKKEPRWRRDPEILAWLESL